MAYGSQGVFLFQKKYATDLLMEIGLLGCKPNSTPIDSQLPSEIDDSGDDFEDATHYHD